MSAEKCIHLHRWSRPTPGQDRFEVKYLKDTHKPEAILLSLTPLVFERFLPSLTLWLSPNCLLKNGWEIKGIERPTIEKFSRRTAQVEQHALENNVKNAEAKGKLGKVTREQKDTGKSVE